jgi:hypothetical protein
MDHHSPLTATTHHRHHPPPPPLTISSSSSSFFFTQLDFRIEVAFMERARKNLSRHSPQVVLPRLYTDLSSTSILTQVRCPLMMMAMEVMMARRDGLLSVCVDGRDAVDHGNRWLRLLKKSHIERNQMLCILLIFFFSFFIFHFSFLIFDF